MKSSSAQICAKSPNVLMGGRRVLLPPHHGSRECTSYGKNHAGFASTVDFRLPVGVHVMREMAVMPDRIKDGQCSLKF